MVAGLLGESHGDEADRLAVSHPHAPCRAEHQSGVGLRDQLPADTFRRQSILPQVLAKDAVVHRDGCSPWQSQSLGEG